MSDLLNLTSVAVRLNDKYELDGAIRTDTRGLRGRAGASLMARGSSDPSSIFATCQVPALGKSSPAKKQNIQRNLSGGLDATNSG
jgi:hypothetical protein